MFLERRFGALEACSLSKERKPGTLQFESPSAKYSDSGVNEVPASPRPDTSSSFKQEARISLPSQKDYTATCELNFQLSPTPGIPTQHDTAPHRTQRP